MRITRQQMFMEMAEAAAKRSTCFRLNVGAIIVRDNTPVSVGYNGPPSGQPHCSGNDCPGRDLCLVSIHAEVNAIRRGPGDLKGADIYVTDSPCLPCAELIMKSRIDRLFYRKLYRVNEHLIDLRQQCEIYRVMPNGMCVDHFSLEFVEI